MKGFVQSIEGLATWNDEFHNVLHTAMSCQLVPAGARLVSRAVAQVSVEAATRMQ